MRDRHVGVRTFTIPVKEVRRRDVIQVGGQPLRVRDMRSYHHVAKLLFDGGTLLTLHPAMRVTVTRPEAVHHVSDWQYR